VPELRTEITEVVTALGLTGVAGPFEALRHPPASVRNVPAATWDRLLVASDDPNEARSFDQAWENGMAFLNATDGLRGRRPLIVEWRGPARPIGYEFLPADLRVDHVYLVSCKYLSRVLFNPSPAHLFDHALEARPPPGGTDWYFSTVPHEYQALYNEARELIDATALPSSVGDLDVAQRGRLRDELPRPWDGALKAAYINMSDAVSAASCARWRERLPTLATREAMLWRLLRFASAPYFVLGSSSGGPMRIRVATPWDWRQRFQLRAFDIDPKPAGQPTVTWSAEVRDRDSGALRSVAGHVEIRWSHGRFSAVEAKVYLDTPHSDVPGYFPLA
jgi:hypothetical protein